MSLFVTPRMPFASAVYFRSKDRNTRGRAKDVNKRLDEFFALYKGYFRGIASHTELAVTVRTESGKTSLYATELRPAQSPPSQLIRTLSTEELLKILGDDFKDQANPFA